MFSSEWRESSFSPLEKTLRLPKVFKHTVILFVKRPLLFWLLGFIFFDLFLSSSFFIWTFSIIGATILELFLLRSWYVEKVIPEHKERLNNSVELYNQCVKDPNESYLRDFIETITDNSAWGIVHFIYLELPIRVWEFLFAKSFSLLVKPVDANPKELLVGFENMYFKVDQATWELAQSSDSPDFDQRKKDYLEKYGSSIEKWDLKTPTLREVSQRFEDMLAEFKSKQNPSKALQSQKDMRMEKLSLVKDKLKINAGYFEKLLKIAQDYVRLDQDRKIYAFQYDYYLRQLIFMLADSKGVEKSEVFDYRWEALLNKKNNS